MIMSKLFIWTSLKVYIFALFFLSVRLYSQDSSSAELSVVQQQSTSIARVFPSSDVEQLLRKKSFHSSTISTMKKVVLAIENCWDRQLDELEKSGLKDDAKRQWLAKCRDDCAKLEKDSCGEVIESARNDELKILCAMMIQKNATCLQSPICIESLRIAQNRASRIRSLITDFDADLGKAKAKAVSDESQTPQKRQHAFLGEMKEIAEDLIGKIYGNLSRDQLNEVFYFFEPISNYDEFIAKLPPNSARSMEKERLSWSK